MMATKSIAVIESTFSRDVEEYLKGCLESLILVTGIYTIYKSINKHLILCHFLEECTL